MKTRKAAILSAVLSALLYLGSSKPAHAEREVSLNFRDAELMAVLEMYAKLVGKAFVPAEQINGKVTIITPKPVPESQAIKMLFSILDMRGFAVAEVDNYYKVVPKAAALQSAGTSVQPGTAGDRLITEVIKPKHIAAMSLLESARNLVSQDAKLTADQTLNILVVTDTASNVQKLRGVIADLDKVADAQVTRSYQLQYAKVDSLAPLVDAMLQGKSGGSTPPSATGFSLSAAPVAGTTAAPVSSGGGAPGLAPPTSPGGSAASGGQNGAVLQDVRSNTLIVTASQYMHQQIDDVIRSLDKRSAQILLEATIVEVTLNQNTKFGVQWQYFLAGPDGAQSGVSLSDGSKPETGTDVRSLLQFVKAIPAAQGFSFALLKANEYAALLNMVASDSAAKILSSPHLVASNNQEAALRIGNEVPLLKEQRFDQNNRQIRTFDREKVGLEIKMVPSIAQNRDVSLKIFLKNSAIVQSTQNFETNQFIVAGREVVTDVVVNDQQTLVISGLIRDDVNKSNAGLPGLREVPFIGKLLGQQSNQGDKVELLVLIRPQIIASEGEADRSSDRELSKHPAAVDAANINVDMPEFDL